MLIVFLTLFAAGILSFMYCWLMVDARWLLMVCPQSGDSVDKLSYRNLSLGAVG